MASDGIGAWLGQMFHVALHLTRRWSHHQFGRREHAFGIRLGRQCSRDFYSLGAGGGLPWANDEDQSLLGGLTRTEFMKRVFASPDSVQVGLVCSVLESAQIPCEVRNEAVSQVLAGLAFISELWVLHDEHYDEAVRLIAQKNPDESAA